MSDGFPVEYDPRQLETLVRYTDEIEIAISNGLEYVALALALALPDICAELEHRDRYANRDRYARWCEENNVTSYEQREKQRVPFISGSDLWQLRCAFLHNGTSEFGIPPGSPDYVLRRFNLNRRELSPGKGKVRVRDHNTGSVAASAESICMDIVRGVRAWLVRNAESSQVLSNLESLLNLDRK